MATCPRARRVPPRLARAGVAPRLGMGRPAALAARRRPGPVPRLRLRAHLARGLAPRSRGAMPGTHAGHEPRGSPRRLHALVRLSPDNAPGLCSFRYASCGASHDLMVLCGLLCLEKLPQLLYIILELGRQRLAHFVNFFDNRVLPHRLALKFFRCTNNRWDVARVATDVFDTAP
jgi:hypothetical protein